MATSVIPTSRSRLRVLGYDVKAGIIFRPVEESPFRIGAYVNSPVFYDLSLSAAHG